MRKYSTPWICSTSCVSKRERQETSTPHVSVRSNTNIIPKTLCKVQSTAQLWLPWHWQMVPWGQWHTSVEVKFYWWCYRGILDNIESCHHMVWIFFCPVQLAAALMRETSEQSSSLPGWQMNHHTLCSCWKKSKPELLKFHLVIIHRISFIHSS